MGNNPVGKKVNNQKVNKYRRMCLFRKYPWFYGCCE